jgi:hypothetical protein
MKWLGIAVPATQLLFTGLFDAKYFFFIAYTLNLQNIAFLPSLGVNNPS